MRAAKLKISQHKRTGEIYLYPINSENYDIVEIDVTFHKFSQAISISSNGETSPVAIIETVDGNLEVVPVNAIRFVKQAEIADPYK